MECVRSISSNHLVNFSPASKSNGPLNVATSERSPGGKKAYFEALRSEGQSRAPKAVSRTAASQYRKSVCGGCITAAELLYDNEASHKVIRECYFNAWVCLGVNNRAVCKAKSIPKIGNLLPEARKRTRRTRNKGQLVPKTHGRSEP